MSGIAGIVNFRGRVPGREVVSRMSSALSARGGGDAEPWMGRRAALIQRPPAHRGEEACGPMEGGHHVAVLDGRLLDGGGLAAEVESETKGQLGSGDTALLLQSWRAWGSDAITKLSGDFALAVYDSRDAVLHLGRDRVGVRPLYYSWKDGKFAFASDPRVLLVLDWVSAEIAQEELAEFLSFRYTHAPRTLLRDIRQLPAGHLARVDATGVRLHRWWAPWYPTPDTPTPNEDQVRDRVGTALSRAVDRRLQGEQKVGIQLSGGVASSSILAMTRKHPEVEVTAWTVALEGDGSDETGLGGRVAKLFEVPHRSLRISRADFLGAMDDVVGSMGQPPPTPAAVTEYLLCRACAEDAPVLLSGIGADEILGGPTAARLVRELRLIRGLGLLPRGTRKAIDGLAAGIGVPSGWLGHELAPGLERGIGGSSVFNMDTRMSLLRDPAHVRPGMRRTMLEPLYNEAVTDPFNQVLHVYLRGWLAEDMVLRSDRVSALAGLDLRYPMLDHELVSLCAGFPGGAKAKRRRGRWWGKWPLRQLLEGSMPDQLIWRPDRGMPSAIHRWLRGEARDFLEERIVSVCEDPLGLFRTSWIREMARAHVRGNGDYGPQLWTLIFFDQWWRSLR